MTKRIVEIIDIETVDVDLIPKMAFDDMFFNLFGPSPTAPEYQRRFIEEQKPWERKWSPAGVRKRPSGVRRAKAKASRSARRTTRKHKK